MQSVDILHSVIKLHGYLLPPLGQAFRLDQRINSKIEQVRSLNDLAAKCTSTITGMPGNPNRGKDSIGDIIAKIVDLQEEINRDIDALVDSQAPHSSTYAKSMSAFEDFGKVSSAAISLERSPIGEHSSLYKISKDGGWLFFLEGAWRDVRHRRNSWSPAPY